MAPPRKLPLLLPVITALVSAFILAPIALSVLAGLVNNYSTGISSGLTLRWLGEVLDVYGSTIIASLTLALLCVVGCLLLGVPCACAPSKARTAWRAGIIMWAMGSLFTWSGRSERMAWPLTNKRYRCSERSCDEKLGGLLNPMAYCCTHRSYRRVFCPNHVEDFFVIAF